MTISSVTLPTESGVQSAKRAVMLAFELMRPKCCAAAACYVLLSAWVGVEAWLTLRTIVAALAIALVVGAAFAFNDVQDEVTDSLTKPNRPLPSKRVSRGAAFTHSVMLAAASLVLASWLGAWPFAVMTGYVILSALYSMKLKGTVLAGNVTMALLIGSIPVYTGVAIGQLGDTLPAAALMMFWFSLTQEILFTIEDRDGDRLARLSTVATRLRPAVSLRLFQVAALAFAVAALLPALLGIAADAYIYAVLIFTVVPTLAAAMFLRADADARRLRLSADTMGVVWWTSIIPFLLLR